MAVEIERKFLVTSNAWRDQVRQTDRLRQGYIAGSEGCSVRLRIQQGQAKLGLKSRVSGMRRLEYEYGIPMDDGAEIFESLCVLGRIEKLRHRIRLGEHEWEVDEFLGENLGLVVAEIELRVETERFERPSWLGEEVTDDLRYYNTQLARAPWPTWHEQRTGGESAT
jgi:adenylate cyclase